MSNPPLDISALYKSESFKCVSPGIFDKQTVIFFSI